MRLLCPILAKHAHAHTTHAHKLLLNSHNYTYMYTHCIYTLSGYQQLHTRCIYIYKYTHLRSHTHTRPPPPPPSPHTHPHVPHTTHIYTPLPSPAINNMPDSIGQLQELEELDLSSNPITAMCDGLVECRQLRVLIFNDCQLEELPPNIGK